MIKALTKSNRAATWLSIAGAYAIASAATAAAIVVARPNWFVHANALLLLYWITSALVAAAYVGEAYVHRRLERTEFIGHNEVGFTVSIAGALYGVLLGALTFAASQHFAEARQLVATEAAAATDAWHTAVGLPPGIRTRVRQDVMRYADLMISREWLEMRTGTYDKQADLILMDAIGTADGFSPSNFREASAQSATISQLGMLHDDRQRRLADNESGMSWFEWLVLLSGAVCIVGFCWLFGLENRYAHLAMASVVTVIMASTLVLLFELQYPFQSNLGITSGDWVAAVAHINMMVSGSQVQMRM
jgi:hypothetical protein